MTTPSMIAGRWPTKVKVQCRNEPPFEAAIQFQSTPGQKLSPHIDCPHCARSYYLDALGEWTSDRPLVILPQA